MDDERAKKAEAEVDAFLRAMRGNLDAGPAARRLAGGTRETGFETTLTKGAEEAFKKKLGPIGEGGMDHTYDLRGAQAEGLLDNARMMRSPEGVSFPDHLPDTFKKPWHETFSDESRYADDEPNLAGHWEGERYIPHADPEPMYRHPDYGPEVQPGDPLPTGDENSHEPDDESPLVSLMKRRNRAPT